VDMMEEPNGEWRPDGFASEGVQGGALGAGELGENSGPCLLVGGGSTANFCLGDWGVETPGFRSMLQTAHQVNSRANVGGRGRRSSRYSRGRA